MKLAKKMAVALTEMGHPIFWLELTNPNDSLQKIIQDAMKILILRDESLYL